ncbi:hypothetical protein WJX77_008961 [Trebouxia sp. C0004]
MFRSIADPTKTVCPKTAVNVADGSQQHTQVVLLQMSQCEQNRSSPAAASRPQRAVVTRSDLLQADQAEVLLHKAAEQQTKGKTQAPDHDAPASIQVAQQHRRPAFGRAVSVDYSEQLNTESLSSLNNQVRPNSTSVRDLIYMPSKEVLKAGTDKGRVVISDRSMYKPEPPVDGMTLVVSNLPDLAGVSATTALSSGVTNIAAPSSTAGSRPGYTM